MEKPFKQEDWIAQRPLVLHFNPDGVCATLVTEWIAADGRIANAAFSRTGKGLRTQARIVTSQRTDRETVFHENMLYQVDQPFFGTATQAMHFLQTKGKYYIKLRFKDGTGHALGLINGSHGRYAIFDPNLGSSENCSGDTDLRLQLMKLVLCYMQLNQANFDGIEVVRLKHMKLGEAALLAENPGLKNFLGTGGRRK